MSDLFKMLSLEVHELRVMCAEVVKKEIFLTIDDERSTKVNELAMSRSCPAGAPGANPLLRPPGAPQVARIR
ncbi:hypothetical protein [Streptomyces montanisoli]|uniref:Uncharacterized protein n=1 Tax=Streptomyces montanisoli TaxID=2798581 RepID=A0A940M8Q0_9ACTN|nr:hypothetical protein [Streptomyces montanisoli]MBP0456347.1 hypothetical protein [Streptomyces montanisoli]